MKKIVLLLILLSNYFLISQNTNDSIVNDSLELNQVLLNFDSLKYSESDFNKMIKYYKENIELNSIISEKASNGDKNASHLLDLLSLSYEKAIDQIGTSDVKVMIYSYYLTVGAIDKIYELNSELDLKIDSLKLRNEFFEREIKLDSLKNN